MPFDRYTLDSDGGHTFTDSDTGRTLRATGPAATQWAQQIDSMAQPPVDSLYAPTPMAPPDRGPDQRLAANPGAVVDVNSLPDAPPPPPPAPPPMTPARAAAALDASQARTARTLGQAPPPAATIHDGGDIDAPDFMTRPGPGQVRQGVAVNEQGQALPIDPTTGTNVVLDGAGRPVTPRKIDPSEVQGADGAVPAEGPPPAMSLERVGQDTTGVSQTSGTTTQRALGPDPRALAAQRKAENEYTDTERKLAELQSKSASDIADTHERDARAANEHKFRVEMVNQETDDRMSKILDRRMAKIAAIESSNVDPARLWNNMDTGQKIAAALSLALGAFGGGISGSESKALGIMQSAIDRDIKLQMADIEKKKGEFSMLGQAADDVRQLGGDRIAQSHAMRSAAADLAAVQIKQAVARAEAAVGYTPSRDDQGNPIAQSPYSLIGEKLVRGMKLGQARDDRALSEQMRGTVSSTSQTTRNTQSTRDAIAAVPTGGSTQPDDIETVMLRDEHGAPHRWRPRGTNTGDIAKYRDYSTNVNEIRDTIAEMRRIWADKTVPGWSNQYDASSARAAALVSTALGMGVLQKYDAEEAKRIQAGIFSGKDVIGDLERFAHRRAQALIDQTDAEEVALHSNSRAPAKKGAGKSAVHKAGK